MNRTYHKTKCLSYILILFFILTTLPSLSTQNKDICSSERFIHQVDNNNIPDFDEIFNPIIKQSYVPIDSITADGNDLTAEDEISVYHSFNLTLNEDNSLSDSFSIDVPNGYSSDSLQYNMTISSTSSIYPYQTGINKGDDQLGTSRIRYAFKFDIDWDYAIFFGVELVLYPSSSGYGSDELEIFLVDSDTSGFPNMSSILSTEINGPYNASNPLPSNSTSTFSYYDFEDVIIPQGSYYVVANLSSYDVDDNNGFIWRSQQVSIDRTYYHDGTAWQGPDPNGRSLTFKVELLQSDDLGNPLTYTNPVEIALEDNGTPITSTTEIITSLGVHTITSNTSVNILLNNSYSFSRSFIASTVFSASNSSFYDYSIAWEVIWDVNLVDLSTYTNPVRMHSIITPKDWNKESFSILLNDSIPISGQNTTSGFSVDLDILFIDNKYFEGEITLQTSSHNYLYDSNLNSDEYSLGYWTTNSTHAFGYEGSSVISDIYIRNDPVTEETTGNLNITLFSPDGTIIPYKSDVQGTYGNLSYVDASNYTLLDTIQESAGYYSIQTAFDPSIYGSDVEGYWTVMYLWRNGTEVGFFSKRITVNKPTLAEFEWETYAGSGIWTNDTLMDIRIISGDSINVRVYYYNISDPFFTIDDNLIKGASILFSSDFGVSDLILDTVFYTASVTIIADIGTYVVSLIADGEFLERHNVQFSIEVLHEISAIPEKSVYSVYYTENALARFTVVDVSNSNAPVFPDTIELFLDGNPVASNHYSNSTVNNMVEIELDSTALGLEVGSYELDITISKRNYIVDYYNEITSVSFSISVEEMPLVVEIVDSVDVVEINNQYTVSFEVLDIVNSVPQEDLVFSVSFDVPEVELISITEDEGLYSIIFRVNEPKIATLNIFISASADGYVTLENYLLTTISIDLGISPPNEFPLGILLGVIATVLVVASGVVLYFLFKDKISEKFKVKTFAKERIRNIYQSAMMIKKILVVHQETSLPVYEKEVLMHSELDPSIISGVLQAISTIGMEMMGAATGIKRIEYYGFTVTSAYSGAYIIYVFSETELVDEFEEGVRNIARWFDLIFGYDSLKWDGSMNVFNEYKSSIDEKISDELYLWLLYPLSVGEQILNQLSNYGTIDKEILSFIYEKGKVSLIHIMDEIIDFDKEDILYSVFNLVNSGVIQTSTND